MQRSTRRRRQEPIHSAEKKFRSANTIEEETEILALSRSLSLSLPPHTLHPPPQTHLNLLPMNSLHLQLGGDWPAFALRTDPRITHSFGDDDFIGEYEWGGEEERRSSRDGEVW